MRKRAQVLACQEWETSRANFGQVSNCNILNYINLFEKSSASSTPVTGVHIQGWRSVLKRGWALVYLYSLRGSDFAATHPVPLQFNVDTRQVSECHEDKAKGKAVHSAIPMGCKSCHEIRITKTSPA